MKPSAANVVSMPKMPLRRFAVFGFTEVAGYRLYSLDGANKVASADWIEADDDNAAIEIAKEIFDGQVAEVWQGRRLVGRVDGRAR